MSAPQGIRRFVPFLLLALSSCAVNPVTGHQELSLVSPGEEVAMGARLYPVYTQASNGPFRDDALQRYVRQVGSRLAAVSHRPGLPWEFNVVNESSPNAWSLPGGKISVTRGLATLLRTEDQLAALLGHEIVHAAARHAARAMTREAVAGVVVGLGTAAAGPEGAELVKEIGGLAAGLTLLKYSRDEEREADAVGMSYLARAGYSPRGMAEVMEILLAQERRKPGSLEALFSSHPLTVDRLVAARRFATGLRSPPPDPDAPRRFAEARLRLDAVARAYAAADEGLKALGKHRLARAVECLQEAVSLAPKEAVPRAWLGASLLAAGDVPRARESAERGVSLDPDLHLTRLVAARAALASGEYRRSSDHARAALALVPDDPDALFMEGSAREKLGDVPAAAAAYLRLLEVSQGSETGETAYARQRLRRWGYLR